VSFQNLELVAIWHGAGDLGYPFGPLVRLLMLLGQRRQEVGGMEAPEVRRQRKCCGLFRPSGVKNDQIHDVPLPTVALTIIRELPRFCA